MNTEIVIWTQRQAVFLGQTPQFLPLQLQTAILTSWLIKVNMTTKINKNYVKIAIIVSQFCYAVS